MYPTYLEIPYKQRVVISHNSLPLGKCRELWLIFPSPWLELLTNEVTSNSYNTFIVLLYTVARLLQFSNELVNIKKWL